MRCPSKHCQLQCCRQPRSCDRTRCIIQNNARMFPVPLRHPPRHKKYSLTRRCCPCKRAAAVNTKTNSCSRRKTCTPQLPKHVSSTYNIFVLRLIMVSTPVASTHVYWIRDHCHRRRPGNIEASTRSRSKVDSNRHQRACRQRDVVQHCHKNTLQRNTSDALMADAKKDAPASPMLFHPKFNLVREQFAW